MQISLFDLIGGNSLMSQGGGKTPIEMLSFSDMLTQVSQPAVKTGAIESNNSGVRHFRADQPVPFNASTDGQAPKPHQSGIQDDVFDVLAGLGLMPEQTTESLGQALPAASTSQTEIANDEFGDIFVTEGLTEEQLVHLVQAASGQSQQMGIEGDSDLSNGMVLPVSAENRSGGPPAGLGQNQPNVPMTLSSVDNVTDETNSASDSSVSGIVDVSQEAVPSQAKPTPETPAAQTQNAAQQVAPILVSTQQNRFQTTPVTTANVELAVADNDGEISLELPPKTQTEKALNPVEQLKGSNSVVNSVSGSNASSNLTGQAGSQAQTSSIQTPNVKPDMVQQVTAGEAILDPSSFEVDFENPAEFMQRLEARVETQVQAVRQTQSPVMAALLNRVGEQFLERFNGKSSSFEIRLDPPELGKVDVRVEVGKDGKVMTVLAARDPAVVEALLRGAKTLENTLTQAGLSLSEGGVQVELDKKGAFAFSGQNENQKSNQPFRENADGADVSEETATNEPVLQTWARRRGLDVTA